MQIENKRNTTKSNTEYFPKYAIIQGRQYNNREKGKVIREYDIIKKEDVCREIDRKPK